MKPPFRADQVGSLLRPAYLAQARKDRKLQDKAIQEAIRTEQSFPADQRSEARLQSLQKKLVSLSTPTGGSATGTGTK